MRSPLPLSFFFHSVLRASGRVFFPKGLDRRRKTQRKGVLINTHREIEPWETLYRRLSEFWHRSFSLPLDCPYFNLSFVVCNLSLRNLRLKDDFRYTPPSFGVGVYNDNTGTMENLWCMGRLTKYTTVFICLSYVDPWDSTRWDV